VEKTLQSHLQVTSSLTHLLEAFPSLANQEVEMFNLLLRSFRDMTRYTTWVEPIFSKRICVHMEPNSSIQSSKTTLVQTWKKLESLIVTNTTIYPPPKSHMATSLTCTRATTSLGLMLSWWGWRISMDRRFARESHYHSTPPKMMHIHPLSRSPNSSTLPPEDSTLISHKHLPIPSCVPSIESLHLSNRH
jgi:hypothetical protein